jgi:hypothetical protein
MRSMLLRIGALSGCFMMLATVVIADPVEWSKSNGGNGHFYEIVPGNYSWTAAQAEPPRDCRRLHFLRGWSHGTTKQILPRGPRTGSPAAG